MMSPNYKIVFLIFIFPTIILATEINQEKLATKSSKLLRRFNTDNHINMVVKEEQKTNNCKNNLISSKKLLSLMVLLYSNCLLPKTEGIRVGHLPSTNLTETVKGYLGMGQYEMALGCPVARQTVNNFWSNNQPTIWLPCPTSSLDECNLIRPLIISEYEDRMNEGKFNRGYNLGSAYTGLQYEGRLRCTIEEASEWKKISLEHLYALIGIYTHNIHILNIEKEIWSAKVMYNFAKNIINQIDSITDRKKLNDFLYMNRSAGAINFQMQYSNLIQYKIPSVQLNLFDLKPRQAARLSRALQQGLIINEMDVFELNDGDSIKLSKGLKKSNAIRQLFIFGQDLTQIGIFALAQMLLENKSITNFLLIDSIVTEDVIKEFSKVLTVNNLIENLGFVKDNPVMPMDNNNQLEVVKELSSGLSTNKRLKRLDLSNCRLNSEGIANIIKALSSNNQLEVLILGYDQVDDQILFLISSILVQQFIQREIYLHSNLVSDQGATALINILKQNLFLCAHLDSKKISDSIRDQMREVINWENRTCRGSTSNKLDSLIIAGIK